MREGDVAPGPGRRRAWPAIFGVCTVLGVLVGSAPALVGGWVYDDRSMIGHAAMDDAVDLWLTFSRTSADYIAGNEWPFGVTYRPFSMASLIAVLVVAPDQPLWHHLVSLLLHGATCVGLFVVARRTIGRDDHAGAHVVTALFALHPTAIESYGWINGRSDVLAGAALAGLAACMPFGRPTTRARLMLAAPCAFVACLAKEPASVAVIVLAIASLLPPRGLGTLPDRARLAAPAAVGVALVAALLLRASATAGHCAGARALLADPGAPLAVLKTVALGASSLLVPLPRAMLSLSWQLEQPFSALMEVGLVMLVVALLAAARARRIRALVLLLGAVALLVPVIAVRQMVWMGFDRYLYIPALLVALAAADGCCESRWPTRPAARWGVLVLGVPLVVASFLNASAYADHETWLKSLVLTRPEDPTGWIMTADYLLKERGAANARATLENSPWEGLPPAPAHDLAELWFKVGDVARARAIVDRALDRHPGSSQLWYSAMMLRAGSYDLDGALAAAEQLRDTSHECHAMQVRVRRWLAAPDLPAGREGDLQRLLGWRCRGSGKCINE
jgi:hypothetical protein